MAEDIKIDEKQLIEKFNKELRAIVDKIFAKSQQNILNNGTSNEGFLLKSGSVIQKGDLHFQIIYNAPYAEAIEYGTDPHMPPVAPIERWVRKKLLIQNPKEARSIAWAVAKAIKKQGTQPQPFIRPAIQAVKKWV